MIDNLRPKKNELPVYRGSPSPKKFDYGLIAVSTAFSPKHQVVTLAGITGYGTQGAAEFVTQEDRVQELLSRLLVRTGEAMPSFEALQRGNLTEEISVTAEATPLQTASSEKSSLVTGTQLSSIALKGRDFFGLLDILPGVVDTRNRDNTSNAGTLSGMHVNGLNNNTINYTIDGVTANDTGSNSDVHYNGNMDAIAEVKVLTSNYQAEFGRKAGATISVITRGGTRDFHGGAYWSHRHEQFNANNFFNNRSGIGKSPYRFNIAGYNVSGPIKIGGFNRNKDKLFFFFGEEFTRQRRDFGTQYRSMPTALERNGDFSQSFDTGGKLIPIIDPSTRQAFAGNVIPMSLINPVGQAIVNFLPSPNYVDPVASLRLQRNYAVAASGQYPRRNDTLRIDVNPTQRLHAYYRLIQEPENQDAPWSQWFTGSNYLLQYARLWRAGPGPGGQRHLHLHPHPGERVHLRSELLAHLLQYPEPGSDTALGHGQRASMVHRGERSQRPGNEPCGLPSGVAGRRPDPRRAVRRNAREQPHHRPLEHSL